MTFRRYQTLEEAIDILENENDDHSDSELIIIPPSPDELTDEEDVNDENLDASTRLTDVVGELEILSSREVEKTTIACLSQLQKEKKKRNLHERILEKMQSSVL